MKIIYLFVLFYLYLFLITPVIRIDFTVIIITFNKQIIP
ncbi:hypothetical protein ykris0001_27200 [Yersinia kristensenii ATCC 33638]|nr:hypothetical protein ykris0001_27200 [Yersinia kristensenii ATCC 33638]